MSTAALSRAILVVDDDPMMRDLLTHLMHAAISDSDIVAVADGEQAVTQLAERTFPLIITDYHMPGMTGLELAQVAKTHQPNTCVVLMSAEGVSELERQQQALPVDFSISPSPFPSHTSPVSLLRYCSGLFVDDWIDRPTRHNKASRLRGTARLVVFIRNAATVLEAEAHGSVPSAHLS
jgi:CheY-like chemotaxis protein